MAVVADTWWRAKTALELLPIEWDYGPNTGVNSKDVALQTIEVLNEKTGAIALDEGDALGTMKNSAQVVEAVYSAPHQARRHHGTSGLYGPDQGQSGGDLAGNQAPEGALQEASRHAGVAPENVHVHNCFLVAALEDGDPALRWRKP